MEKKKVIAYAAVKEGEPMERIEIERREIRGCDVEFDVLYCGICHSDLHTIRNDWKGAVYPVVPGHEIIGRVTRVGADVKDFKVGELVGVGCIVESCKHCQHCDEGEEQFCENGVTFSFNSKDKVMGGMTYGGFSKSYVCEDKYVLHIPEFKELWGAAPLLCAGITVYSPLKHWGARGNKVGVIGIGGLGHMAIKIAKAMGNEVTVFTTTQSKVEDSKKLGADKAVLSKDEEAMKNCEKLDLIIDTVSGEHDVNMYMRTLKVDGALVLVGLPAEPLRIMARSVVSGRKSFAGSNIGGIAETQEMINFCYEHGITAESEVVKIDQVNEAFERLEKGDVRYRFVVDMSTL